jgi:isopenicillin-N N-acyltransferase-like protein
MHSMIRQVELTGSPYTMGLQHGQQLSAEVAHLARERFELAQSFAAQHGVDVDRQQCIELAMRHLDIHRRQLPHVVEEWQGIADGAKLPLEDIFFANALTDFQDVLWQSAGAEVHGCTSFLVNSDATDHGSPLIGQTWDMHASAEQVVTVFRRFPDQGPRSLVVSTAGCLTLIGVNEHGLAVGNNNLRPTDARAGIIYLALLHEALAQSEWQPALDAITADGRASGHNYLVAHEQGLVADIETTATRHDIQLVKEGWFVHTNHYLCDELQALEDPDQDQRSTRFRLNQLQQRLATVDEPLGPELLRQLLSDHEGEQLSVCRHGEGREVRSCAFVVADPARRSIWARLGPPCQGELEEYSLELTG